MSERGRFLFREFIKVTSAVEVGAGIVIGRDLLIFGDEAGALLDGFIVLAAIGMLGLALHGTPEN